MFVHDSDHDLIGRRRCWGMDVNAVAMRFKFQVPFTVESCGAGYDLTGLAASPVRTYVGLLRRCINAKTAKATFNQLIRWLNVESRPDSITRPKRRRCRSENPSTEIAERSKATEYGLALRNVPTTKTRSTRDRAINKQNIGVSARCKSTELL